MHAIWCANTVVRYKWLCYGSALLGVFMLVAGVFVSIKSLHTPASNHTYSGGNDNQEWEEGFGPGPASVW